MENDIQKTIEMHEGVLRECGLWKMCLMKGMESNEWRKRHFTKKKDIDHVRQLIKSYEQIELYSQKQLDILQNKLK